MGWWSRRFLCDDPLPGHTSTVGTLPKHMAQKPASWASSSAALSIHGGIRTSTSSKTVGCRHSIASAMYPWCKQGVTCSCQALGMDREGRARRGEGCETWRQASEHGFWKHGEAWADPVLRSRPGAYLLLYQELGDAQFRSGDRCCPYVTCTRYAR